MSKLNLENCILCYHEEINNSINISERVDFLSLLREPVELKTIEDIIKQIIKKFFFVLEMVKKKFSQDFIEKTARLLKGETITENELSNYKQHKLSRKKYRRLQINVYDKNEQWEIDLAENKDLSHYNNQFRYWLVCIDVYSRYIWVELLKKKSSKNTASKFENILKKAKAAPQKIQCGEGTEFQDIRKHLSKKYNFTVFHTQP